MYVSGTGGGGVRLRSSASTSGSILAVVPEGASVTVRNGSTSSWTAVTYNGTNGFISATYLAKNTSTSGGSALGWLHQRRQHQRIGERQSCGHLRFAQSALLRQL